MPLDRKEAAQLKRLGANIRRLRVARGLSQEALAELVDLHPRSVQKVERGDINVLVTTLLRFRRALKCRWDELMPDA